MPKAKVFITLETRLLKAIDAQVKRREFPSRSAAIEAALRAQAKLQAKVKQDTEYLAILAQLDPEEERALAEERYKGEVFG